MVRRGGRDVNIIFTSLPARTRPEVIKVITTLSYQVEMEEKPRSSVLANLDSRGFKKPSKVPTVYPFPDFLVIS